MTVQQIENTRPATGRPNPFAVVGTDTTKAVNAVDVMAEAKLLNWNVRLRKMETVEETSMDLSGVTTHERMEIPGQFAVIRDNPLTGKEQVIGTVGSDYMVKQNEEIVEYMQNLLEQSGGQVTSAADYYGNGKQVFFTMELPMSSKVHGEDVINHSLAVFVGHDGSMSLTTVLTSLRIMCANMRSQALSSALSSARNRHTKNMGVRMALAKQTLGLAVEGIKAFDAKADAMAQTPLPDADFWEIVNRIWTPKTAPSKTTQTWTEKRRSELEDILHGPTNTNIKGTVWAGYNTITEYLQHTKRHSDEVNATRVIRAAALPSSDLAKQLAQTEKLFLALV